MASHRSGLALAAGILAGLLYGAAVFALRW